VREYMQETDRQTDLCIGKAVNDGNKQSLYDTQSHTASHSQLDRSPIQQSKQTPIDSLSML